jgi:hypothetical protein
MQSKVCLVILLAVPSISRGPSEARLPEIVTSALQSIVVGPSAGPLSVISALASTALPGAWPWALITARSGALRSAISMFTTKRALMNPMPTLAVALKWVSSTTSMDSTPGPHWPTWLGSMTKAHTRSRGAAMSTVPANFMRTSESERRGRQRGVGCPTDRPSDDTGGARSTIAVDSAVPRSSWN